jgi:hypothetical protein
MAKQTKPAAASQVVPVFEEEHDVGSEVVFEEEEKEKLFEENLIANEEEVELSNILPEKQTQVDDEIQVSKEFVEEVIPPYAGLAMTNKDTTALEITSDIAP